MTIGCDIASIDQGSPNWQEARSHGGMRFVGLRAAFGLTQDPLYLTRLAQLSDLGIPSFPYLALTPNLSTPEAQVDAALTHVGPLDRTCFPIALDIEGDRHGLSAAQWLDWVTRARNRVRSSIGVSPILYTSRIYWEDPAGMDNLPAPALADSLGWWKYYPYPVNAPAIYTQAAIDTLTAPPAPAPWGDQWGIHQYQGDAEGFPGFSSFCDLNRLHVIGRGASGDTVRWIQRRLPVASADGAFGPLTTKAVQEFQSSHGLTTDGIVGLDTMQRLAWVPPAP